MKGRRVRTRGFFRILAAFAVLVATVFPWCGTAQAAEEVSVEDLISEMQKYDGREVEITGEAIGDVMMRGDYGWITVNNDAYAVTSVEEGRDFAGYSNLGIAVWAPRDELKGIQVLGGYKNKGDEVRVKGVFHRACPEHGGDSDIHAVSIEVLERGRAIPHPFAWWKLILALALAAVALALASMWRKRTASSLSPARRS
ncbi:MAG: DNA-binding protein [Actinobacteria bacterium]|nr:DNA-binding protein [Actinomycetota bacterium]